MIPALAFDRSLITVRHDEVIHALLELTAPTSTGPTRAPLDVVLVIDRSGSMAGRPLRAVVDASAALLRLAGPDDRIGVVTFDSSVEVALPLAHHDHDTAARIIRGIRSGGSTNLSGGWLRAADLLVGAHRDNAVRRIVLLTDGHANHGVTDAERLAEMVAGGTTRGITSSFIGFADGHDEALLASLADAGRGNDYWCADSDAAAAVFTNEFEGLAAVAAQNLTVVITPTDRIAAIRVLSGHPVTTAADGTLTVSLGDAYSGETRRMLAELRLRPQHDHGPVDAAAIEVRWASVVGAPALHSVLVPVVVTVGTSDEANQASADPRVVEQVAVLRAAGLERAARDAADRGDFGAATSLLRAGADHLRYVGQSQLAAELEASASELVDGAWDQTSSKRLYSRSREKSRGRRSRFETDPLSAIDPVTGLPGTGWPGITPDPGGSNPGTVDPGTVDPGTGPGSTGGSGPI